MKIDLTRAKLPGLAASLTAGALLLAAASHGHAAPQVGGAAVRPPGLVVAVGKVSTFGTVNRAPKSIKPPPGPNIRDHRGGKQTSPSTAQGGVTVTSQPRKPGCRPGFLHTCLADPTGRDHRSK